MSASASALDEADVAKVVCELIKQKPGARIGVWGVIGRTERIIEYCPQIKNNLVWLGDRDQALTGKPFPGTNLVVSIPSSLSAASVDALVLGVRPALVDEIIAQARPQLKDGAVIISLKGVQETKGADEGASPTAGAYEGATPLATYSPWNIDEAFQLVYSEAMRNTLVDKYRCYELWQLVEQSAKLDRGALLEVGVWRGGTGALIAKQALICELSDPVYLCDTFKGVVKNL